MAFMARTQTITKQAGQAILGTIINMSSKTRNGKKKLGRGKCRAVLIRTVPHWAQKNMRGISKHVCDSKNNLINNALVWKKKVTSALPQKYAENKFCVVAGSMYFFLVFFQGRCFNHLLIIKPAFSIKSYLL